ncbi:MAG: metallophosphoesterase [Paludibacter sp.]
MKSIFFITIFTITVLMVFYVTLRGWQVLQPFTNLKTGYLVTNIFLFVVMFASMALRNVFPDGVAKVVAFVGFSYMIVVIYLLLSFLATDIVRLFTFIFHLSTEWISMFRFWAFSASLVLITVAMLVGNYKFNNPAIVHLHLKSDKPKQDKKMRIVAVSDLHLGVSVDKSYLQKYVALINAQNPDIVLLAGDIADHSTAPIIRQNMAEEFRAIKSTHGVYAISGNHEYFGENPYELQEYLTKAGVTYLRDSAVMIDSSFYVVGRDDKINPKRKSLAQITSSLDTKKAMILLDHQPFHLNEAVENHYDLQISGHTHNGQFFPGNLIVSRMYEVAHGYLKKGATHFYVSSGLGLWGPQYRIGTQSEVVVIDFEF